MGSREHNPVLVFHEIDYDIVGPAIELLIYKEFDACWTIPKHYFCPWYCRSSRGHIN